jgi:hypothetical protein
MGNSKIVLFEEDERSLNYKFEKFADRLKSTEILSLEYDKDEFLKKYEIIGQEPELGSVYYKHPNKPGFYINSSLDEYYFMEEKIEFYAKVAQLLGATGFEATVVLDSIEEMDFSGNGDIKYKVVEFDAKYKETVTNKISQRLELKRKIEKKTDFDIKKGFIKATDFVNSHNFSADTKLQGLIDSRDPENDSFNKEQTLKTEITSDYNQLLEFSAGLNVMKDVFKLNMGFSKKFKSIKKVNLDMTIYF